ncbi:MAG TPA: MarR family transcriptional regulator [Polyangiaceae bacterium]|jgi:DNA-binding MarR family transcriptional regulator|nr:MarR family transcriptional regulator [Polyangiaceae bacterium]
MAKPNDEALSLLRIVWELDHRLQSQSKRMRARTGVTGPQRLVLRMLLVAPDAAPSAIARSLFFDRSTVTVILRGLERANLVRRAPNATDRRAITLALTSKGRRIAEQQTGTIESLFRRAVARLDKREVKAARRVLEEIARELV